MIKHCLYLDSVRKRRQKLHLKKHFKLHASNITREHRHGIKARPPHASFIISLYHNISFPFLFLTIYIDNELIKLIKQNYSTFYREREKKNLFSIELRHTNNGSAC